MGLNAGKSFRCAKYKPRTFFLTILFLSSNLYFFYHNYEFTYRNYVAAIGVIANLNSQFLQLQTSQIGLFFFEFISHLAIQAFFLRILHLKLAILSI